jgi:predicted RNase H-like HicB family nuclease
MTMPSYPINVFWSDEDDAWVADVPDLAYCSAVGGTPHEAVAEVEMAIQAWLEAAMSSGREVPLPSPRAMHA